MSTVDKIYKGAIMGYTKLFGEIVHSTIWQESSDIKVVWVTMLALKDERHQVMASVPGLAKAAGVSRKSCEEALYKFMSPDPDSRSQEYEGRRIEKCDGGWYLLNGENYRKKQSIEERKEYQKQWVKDKRSKVSTNVADFDNVDTTEHNRTEQNISKQIITEQNKTICETDVSLKNNSAPKKEEKPRTELQKCKTCNNDGRISKEVDGNSFTYRCSCENGKRYPNFPAEKEKHDATH